MGIRFGEVVRGNGKVFVHMTDDAGTPGGGGWRAASQTEEGLAVPARVVPAPTGIEGGVLVLPVLDVTQVATVSAGEERAELTVAPQWAKHRSQINTATRNRVAMAIRNCDEGVPWGDDGLGIEVLEVLQDADRDVMRIELRLQAGDRKALSADLDLRVQDRAGRILVGAGPTALGDVTLEDPQYPGFWHRRVTVSVRIPHDAAEVVLWARSASSVLAESVMWLDGEAMAGLRERGFYDTLSADRDPIYDQWFRDRHRVKPWELDAQRAVRFEAEPTFSLVVPLFRTPIDYFREMADSVLAQTYPHLELVLVDASPEDVDLAREVERYRQVDERVRVVELAGNRGIVGNTGAGVDAATGDFVAFMDHDDVIEPDLLYHYAKAVNDYPDTDLLYCDEDKLVDGRYEQAFFKPDWSPDLLRSQNYVSHLLCVRASLLREVGLSGPEYEGAQDHDLVLRVGERARNVFHVRRSLYHWRIHPGSTAQDAGEKAYTSDAGVRAVQAELDRLGIAGTAYEDEHIANVYHVRYRFDEGDEPLVSIVIPNKDAVVLLSGCLDSIRERTTYRNYEVVVVENNSADEATFAYYQQAQEADPHVRVVTYVPEKPGFNFAAIMNFGIGQAQGDYVLMLNNDTKVITPEWVEQLLGHTAEPGVGCVGAKLLYPDDTIQHAGVIVHRGGPNHTGIFLPRDCQNYFHAAQVTRDFLGVTGACLLVSKELFDRLGGLDEAFAADYNDVDFCLRVHAAGYRNVYEPTCELYHLESVSRGKNETHARALRFRHEKGILADRWPQYHEFSDPYMNPNLWPINPYWHLDV